MGSRSGIVSDTPSHDALSDGCHVAAESPRARINVLGPVELTLDGRLLSVRSSRARRLLAMLALYRDRVVSTDRLADGVWGERLPGEPAAALHSQISRLRKVLGPTATGIETTSGGYRLRSSVIGIDLVTFDALLASAGAEPDQARRVQLLECAVAMVRGAAFEDLEVDDAYIKARRVEDRLAEARYDLTVSTVTASASTSMPRAVPMPIGEVRGRDADAAAITTLLGSTRAVTLTGPGGVGKTTLAMVVAHRHCRITGWRNAFVDLAAVRAQDDVAPAFARALGIGRVGAQSWPLRLAEALGDEPLLLLVDNAEHVIAAAAELIGDLIAGTGVVVLTTSRVVLDIRGEQVWAVKPLDRGSAYDLFRQRAHAKRPAWNPSPEDADRIAKICRRVDRLPLAIELAAAQIRWRTPAEIAAALERPLDALEPVSAGRGRHAGLRTVMEDSYRLLEPEQQHLLDQLGIFAGGFTVATAAKVCLPSGVDADADAVALHIGGLVEHSLVGALARSMHTRYALLDTVRHYALERLHRRGELADARSRHAVTMLELTESAASAMWGQEEPTWVRLIDDERADICAAHRHLIETAQVELALRLATAAYWVSWPRGWSDLRRLISASLPLDGVIAPEVLAPALGVAADLALHDGDPQRAAQLARRSLLNAEGRPKFAHLAHAVLGDLALFDGDAEGAVLGWRAAEEGLAAVYPGLAPWASAAMALALAHGGRHAEASAQAARAVASADLSRCPTSQAFARYVAAEAELASDADRAVALLVDAITIAMDARAMFVANLARLTLATLTSRRGDPLAALGHYPVVLQEWRRAGHWAQQWISLRTLVPALALAGAAGQAAAILGGLQAHGQAVSWGADGSELRNANELLERQLGDAYAEHVARGAALTPAGLVLFAEEASRCGSDADS